EDRRRPLVVTGPLRRVPGRRVAGAVVQRVGGLVEAVPAPGRAAAGLPLVALPGLERRVLAHGLHLPVGPGHGLVGVHQHLGIGAHAVGLPRLLAGVDVVGRDEAAHAPFAAADAGDHLVLEHVRRVGVDGAELRVAVLHAPHHLAGLGVQRDEHAVGLLQEDLALGIGQAAVHGVA